MFANTASCLGADLVKLLSGCPRINGENRVALQTMPVPAEADPIDALDTFDVVERVRDFVDEFGFDAVEQAAADAANGADEEDEDRGRDDQSDDGIGERESEHHTDPTSNHGQ